MWDQAAGASEVSLSHHWVNGSEITFTGQNACVRCGFPITVTFATPGSTLFELSNFQIMVT